MVVRICNFNQFWRTTKNRSPSDMVCTTQAKTGFKSALVFLRSPPCSDFSVEFLLVTCLSSLTCKNATFSFASRLDLVALFLCWWVLDIIKYTFQVVCPLLLLAPLMWWRFACKQGWPNYVFLSAIEMIKIYSTYMIHHRNLYFPGQQMTIWARCELGWISTKRRAYGVFGEGWDKTI